MTCCYVSWLYRANLVVGETYLTTGDRHVVKTNHATTNASGRNLGNVKRNDHGSATDTEANDKTTNAHLCEGVCSSLEDSANGEEEATSTVLVLMIAVTTHSSARPEQDGGNPTFQARSIPAGDAGKGRTC